MKKKLLVALSTLLACACLCMPFASASGAEQPSAKSIVIPKEEAPNEAEIAEMLATEPIIFVESEYDIKFGPNEDTQIMQADNASNKNIAELAYEYYYKANDSIRKGEIYVTPHDTEESIANLMADVTARVQNETTMYLSCFDFGEAYLPVEGEATERVVNAVYNNEKLGTMTDFEMVFVLNNPSNNTLYMVVAHETYLSPTQSDNRNYKGVGVEMKLSNIHGFEVRDYAPKTQAPSANISYSGGFSAGSTPDGVVGNASFNYEYSTNVESPKIRSVGNIGESVVDIIFEYVDPGSWYGPFCEYNSSETYQCSFVVLEASKSDSSLQYASSVTGRFQKYQNWPFPWVDEYYTINMDTTYKVKDLLQVIEDANA